MTRPVIVTGAGGPAAVCLLRELRRRAIPTVATDVDPFAVGGALADVFVTVPPADAAGGAFAAALVALASEHRARVVIATLDEELVPVAVARQALGGAGARTWMSDPEQLCVAQDKLRTFEVLRVDGVPAVPTVQLDAQSGPAELSPPWILKPRHGRGSRDVVRADGIDEIEAYRRRRRDAVLQPLAAGPEFSADCLAEPGRGVASVLRLRTKTRGGIATEARTFDDAACSAVVTDAAVALGLAGPVNVQGFLTDDGPVVNELNPRFSGGLAMSLAAGADLVGEFLRVVDGGVFDPARIVYRTDAVIARHFVEVVLDVGRAPEA